VDRDPVYGETVRVVGTETRYPDCSAPDPTRQTTLHLGVFTIPYVWASWTSDALIQRDGGLDPAVGPFGCMQVSAQNVFYRRAVGDADFAIAELDARSLPLLHPIPLSPGSADRSSLGVAVDASLANEQMAYVFTDQSGCL
jgi:hypothetical protein